MTTSFLMHTGILSRMQVHGWKATVACPVFSSILTYVVEGSTEERGHLMTRPLTNSPKSVALRGNLWSSMLQWDKLMPKLSRSWQEEDVADWPMDANIACEVVMLKFLRGQESLIDWIRQLSLRSEKVQSGPNLAYVGAKVAQVGQR